MYIYLITNLINGKQYVGQTIRSDPRYRWREHKSEAKRHARYLLGKAIRKYGPENFKFEVIEKVLLFDDLSLLETENIIKYNTLVPNGYNLEKFQERKIVSDHTKTKLSEISQGNRKAKNKSSQFLGVHKQDKLFIVTITKDAKQYYLSCYNEEEAANFYDKMALFLYGSKAIRNFIDKNYTQEEIQQAFNLFTQSKKSSQYQSVDYVNCFKLWRGTVKTPEGKKTRVCSSEEEAAQFVDVIRVLYLNESNPNMLNFPNLFEKYQKLTIEWLNNKKQSPKNINKGVTIQYKKFVARITLHGKNYNFGRFSSYEEALSVLIAKKRELGILWEIN